MYHFSIIRGNKLKSNLKAQNSMKNSMIKESYTKTYSSSNNQKKKITSNRKQFRTRKSPQDTAQMEYNNLRRNGNSKQTIRNTKSIRLSGLIWISSIILWFREIYNCSKLRNKRKKLLFNRDKIPTSLIARWYQEIILFGIELFIQ